MVPPGSTPWDSAAADRGPRVPSGATATQGEVVVHVLGVVVGVLVVSCVLLIALYTAIAVVAVVSTLRGARRHRRLAADLDGILAEVLAPQLGVAWATLHEQPRSHRT